MQCWAQSERAIRGQQGALAAHTAAGAGGVEGEEGGVRRRAAGAFAVVGIFSLWALRSEGARPTPRISFHCCELSCAWDQRVEGARGRNVGPQV